MFKSLLQNQSVRRALCASLAVGVSAVLGYGYAQASICLPVLTALFVVQTSMGTPLRQSIQRALIIFASVVVGTLLANYVKPDSLVVVLLVAALAWIFAWDDVPYRLTMARMVACTLLVNVLVPFDASLYARLFDTMIGAGVGVVAVLALLSGWAADEFRKSLLPVFRVYQAYLDSIEAVLFKKEHAESRAQTKRLEVENVLRSQKMLFPDWVYEPGFNPQLRLGYRFFLVKAEQLGQVLFAMHYTARQEIDAGVLNDLRPGLESCFVQCQELLQGMIKSLEQKKQNPHLMIVKDGIADLERLFQKTVPLPLELLDTSKDYMRAALVVYDLKDLHAILLKLAEALR